MPFECRRHRRGPSKTSITDPSAWDEKRPIFDSLETTEFPDRSKTFQFPNVGLQCFNVVAAHRPYFYLPDHSTVNARADAAVGQRSRIWSAEIQGEWSAKIGEERGKVASNLSLVCSTCNQQEKALEYAKEAVTSCPDWSKLYCCRALALESLGQCEDAQVAIFKAINKCEREILRGGCFTRQLEEYRTIQETIEVGRSR